MSIFSSQLPTITTSQARAADTAAAAAVENAIAQATREGRQLSPMEQFYRHQAVWSAKAGADVVKVVADQ